jgi:hypothetical protein
MNRQQRGHVWLLVIIVVAVAASVVFFAVRQSFAPKPDSDQSTTTEEDSQPASDCHLSCASNLRLSKNVGRKNDAQSLASSVANYINNNSGTMPTDWQNGQLIGASGTTSERTELNVYKQISVAEAPQSALTTDSVRVVRHGVCGQNGTATRGNTITGYAIQYSQLVDLDSGAVEGECINT